MAEIAAMKMKICMERRECYVMGKGAHFFHCWATDEDKTTKAIVETFSGVIRMVEPVAVRFVDTDSYELELFYKLRDKEKKDEQNDED